MRRMAIGCFASLVVLVGLASAQSGLYDALLQDGTQIAAEGDAAPGGGTFSSFSNVQGGGSGDVAFRAALSGGSSGVFRISGGVPAAVARQGQAAPSALVGATYLVFNSLDLNDLGDVAFNAGLDNLDPAPDTMAVFLNAGGITTLLAEEGQPAPGTPGPGGYNYSTPGTPAINDGDSVAFRSTLLDVFSQPHDGVFLATGGVVAPVVLETDTTPIGGTYDAFSSSVDLDEAGRVWFRSVAASPAIFVSDAGVETAVVQFGDPTPAGGTFGALGGFSVDEAGQLAFQAQVIGGSAGSGIFLRASGGSITALALQGGAAPGTGGGIFNILTVQEARPSLNDGGDATFFSNVVLGTTTSGIFRVPAGGSVEAVAVRDATVPSLPTSIYKSFSPPEIDDDGVTAYRAELFANTDEDGDGYVFLEDNCLLIPNPTQCDTDRDGFGNHCDGDFDQNFVVGAIDFSTRFVPDFKAGFDAGIQDGTDLDCNGTVNAIDFATRFVPMFKSATIGPSGLSCAGTIPCPPDL